MFVNKSLNRLDLTIPTLLTVEDNEYSDNPSGFGHVGFVIPTKKTKRLTYDQLLGAITGRVSISVVPQKNFKKK